jgi:hypothetical protein
LSYGPNLKVWELGTNEIKGQEIINNPYYEYLNSKESINKIKNSLSYIQKQINIKDAVEYKYITLYPKEYIESNFNLKPI